MDDQGPDTPGCVHGLLTDRTFYAYDPSADRFSYNEQLLAEGAPEECLTRMIPVANKLFSVLLDGYIAALRAEFEPGTALERRGVPASMGVQEPSQARALDELAAQYVSHWHRKAAGAVQA